MSASNGLIPLLTARKIFASLQFLLSDHCIKFEVAGSIRRMSPYVHDIEIVCVPIKDEIKKLNLASTVVSIFDEPDKKIEYTVEYVNNKRFTNVVDRFDKIKGESTGKYTQRFLEVEGLPFKAKLDLFMPNGSDFYRIYAMRTGSVEYSKRIACAWVRKGWCGTDDGLRLQEECIKKNNKWICQKEKPTLPPVWVSEEDFFNFIGMKYIMPQHR